MADSLHPRLALWVRHALEAPMAQATVNLWNTDNMSQWFHELQVRGFRAYWAQSGAWIANHCSIADFGQCLRGLNITIPLGYARSTSPADIWLAWIHEGLFLMAETSEAVLRELIGTCLRFPVVDAGEHEVIVDEAFVDEVCGHFRFSEKPPLTGIEIAEGTRDADPRWTRYNVFMTFSDGRCEQSTPIAINRAARMAVSGRVPVVVDDTTRHDIDAWLEALPEEHRAWYHQPPAWTRTPPAVDWVCH